MKKLLSVSSSKILIFCAVGLLTTLGAFWHSQTNQYQLDRMNVLNQGVSTCFNRISQTFTALMIKDIHSSYLNRGFMGLSDECLNETIKGINPFKQNVGKGYETLNKLISDVHWFHEMVTRTHSPMVTGKNLDASMSPVTEKFGQMEALKVSLMDEIDATNARIKEVQANDEVLMGVGLLMFVLSLSLLSLQEFYRAQDKRALEGKALNLLRAGQANVGAMVDKLVDDALKSQGMVVTAQVFNDYHGEILERIAMKNLNRNTPAKASEENKSTVRQNETEVEAAPMAPAVEEKVSAANYEGPRSYLKEALVSIQNTQPKGTVQSNEVRDVQLAVEAESLEQILSAAVNKLSERMPQNKKIMISNQVHSDRTVINMFVSGSTFTASELEYFSSTNAQTDSNDMNLVLLKEMVNETNTNWHIENKADRNGNITGMNIRLTIMRTPKEGRTKSLISVIRGKKKDIAKEMMN